MCSEEDAASPPTGSTGREASGAARRPPSVETIQRRADLRTNNNNNNNNKRPSRRYVLWVARNFPRGQRVADDRRGSGPRPGVNSHLNHINFDLDPAVLELGRTRGPMPRDLSQRGRVNDLLIRAVIAPNNPPRHTSLMTSQAGAGRSHTGGCERTRIDTPFFFPLAIDELALKRLRVADLSFGNGSRGGWCIGTIHGVSLLQELHRRHTIPPVPSTACFCSTNHDYYGCERRARLLSGAVLSRWFRAREDMQAEHVRPSTRRVCISANNDPATQILVVRLRPGPSTM